MTQEFLDYLNTNYPVSPPKEIGMGERIATLGTTALPKALSGLSESVAHIMGIPDAKGFLSGEETAPPPASSTAGNIANIGLGGILPAAIEMGITGGVVNPAIKGITGGAPLATRILSDAAQFGVLGAQENTGTGIEQTGEGAILGASTALPRLGRLPILAGLGLASKAYFDAQNPEPVVGDWSRGDINATVLGLAGMLPGVPKVRAQFRSPLTDHFAAEPTTPDIYGAFTEGGGVTGAEAVRQRTSQPDIYQAFGAEPERPNIPPAPEDVYSVLGRMAGVEGAEQAKIDPKDIYEVMGAPREGWQTEPAQPFGKNLQELQIRNEVAADNVRIDRERELGWVHGTNDPIHEASLAPSAANPNFTKLFDPADAAWLKSNLNADVSHLEVQNAMVRLRLGIAQAMVRSDKREAQIAFAKFFEEIGHKPDVDAFTPEIGEAAWKDIVERGKTAQNARSELVSNPLAEGDPVMAATSDAQIQAARKGKIFDLPEYRRTEGGGINPEVLQTLGFASARAVVGGTVGLAEPADSEEQRLWHAAIAAGVFTGLPYAWKIVPMLQKLESGLHEYRARGYLSPEEGGNITLLKGGKVRREASTDLTLPPQIEPRFRSSALPSERSGISDASLQRLQTAYQGRLDAQAEAQKAVAIRGKLQKLPEYMRTQGGGVANPFFDRAGLPEGLQSRIAEIDDGQILEARLFNKEKQTVGHLTAEVQGSELKIYDAGIDSDLQGKKFGLFLYDKLADEATKRNLTLVSDKAVSESAARVYEALEKRGYKVERNPTAFKDISEKFPGRFRWLTNDNKPVFKVYPPETNLASKLKGEGGFAIPELSAAIARAAVGGIAGGSIGAMTDDIGDHSGFLYGAMIGAGAGMFGPAIARSLTKALGETKSIPAASTKDGLTGFFKNFTQKVEESAGAAFAGSEKVTDRFIRFLDQGFGLTMPPQIKSILSQAKGAGSVLLDKMDSALLNISLRFSATDEVKQITNKYLNGQLAGGSEEYLQSLQNEIANNPQVLNYARFAIAGRESITGLQRMLMEGIGDPKMRNIIKESLDKYITQSYRLFTDSRWKPNRQVVENLAKQISELTKADGTPLMGTTNIGDLITHLDQYVREIKQTKGLYVASSPTGQAIEQGLLHKRIAMSDEWKSFLGEINDPQERIYQTVFRLRPIAEASRFFNKIADIKINDVPQVFDSYATRDTFVAKLQQELLDHPSDLEILKKITELKSYQVTKDLAKYGDLKSKLVSRHVWDTLETFDSISDFTSHPWLRSIANAHTAIKLTRTALSPITVMRNIFTSPFFLAIGRGNLQDVKTAYEIFHDSAHPLRQEIFERGIANVDKAKTEFFKEFEGITGSKSFNFGTIDSANLGLGKLDLDLAERTVRRGFRNVLDFYRAPDNITRVTTYLSARRRIAQEMGKAIDDPEVLERATNFTNRYTMNYDALPPAIKGLRQVPLVNLFLSYTAEMGRIGKNLVEDVIKGGNGLDAHGRMYAMTMLGTLLAVPEMLQSASESTLSPSDKRDWDKAKRLMPDYARTRYRFGITRDKKSGQFTYYDFTPLMPHDSYQQMGKAIMAQDWKALAQVNPVLGLQNTPALNIAVTQIAGQDRASFRKFRDIGLGGVGDRFASVAKEVLPPNTPGVGAEALRFQLAYTANDKGEYGLTNAKTGVRITPSDFWLPYYSGIKRSSLNLGVLETRFTNDAKQDVANEIAYANDILKMKDISQELRERTVAKTKLALEAIRERYAEQLGVKQ